MGKGRLEAFSDGVIAIIITIMVLELKVPHGGDLAALRPLLPVFLSYVISFIFVGIYWNNHHHLLHVIDRVNGGIMWANLHLLFWLSLVPATTGWLGEHPYGALPTAAYGINLLLCGVAYLILQRTIIKSGGRGAELARHLGNDLKGNISGIGYATGVGLAFVQHWISVAIYVGIAIMWLIPDRRVARAVEEHAK